MYDISQQYLKKSRDFVPEVIKIFKLKKKMYHKLHPECHRAFHKSAWVEPSIHKLLMKIED